MKRGSAPAVGAPAVGRRRDDILAVRVSVIAATVPWDGRSTLPDSRSAFSTGRGASPWRPTGEASKGAPLTATAWPRRPSKSAKTSPPSSSVPRALAAVRLASGATIPARCCSFSIAHEPTSTFAEQLGCRISDERCVIVDDRCETTVTGLAAGDMTPGMQLVQVASTKGAVAGVACAESLRGHPAIPGVPEPAPDSDD